LVALGFGRGQHVHGFFQQKIESGQTIGQQQLFYLLPGLFDSLGQVGLMLPGLFQREAMVRSHRGHGGPGQEVALYFQTVGVATDSAHNCGLLNEKITGDN
jgi:hypothetical protein